MSYEYIHFIIYPNIAIKSINHPESYDNPLANCQILIHLIKKTLLSYAYLFLKIIPISVYLSYRSMNEYHKATLSMS